MACNPQVPSTPQSCPHSNWRNHSTSPAQPRRPCPSGTAWPQYYTRSPCQYKFYCRADLHRRLPLNLCPILRARCSGFLDFEMLWTTLRLRCIILAGIWRTLCRSTCPLVWRSGRFRFLGSRLCISFLRLLRSFIGFPYSPLWENRGSSNRTESLYTQAPLIFPYPPNNNSAISAVGSTLIFPVRLIL